MYEEENGVYLLLKKSMMMTRLGCNSSASPPRSPCATIVHINYLSKRMCTLSTRE